MNPSSYKTLFIIIFLLLPILLFSACGSDSDDHDHKEVPVGLVLSVDGVDIAMQEESTVTYVNGNAIDVPNGTTLNFTVQFIAEDGDRYSPHTDEGYSLQFEVGSANIIQVTHPINNNQWNLSVTGNNPGSTTITFDLLHLGHSDFTSRPFQVQVIE